MLLSVLLAGVVMAGGVGDLDVVTRVRPADLATAERARGQLELLSCSFDPAEGRVRLTVRNNAAAAFGGEIPYMYGNPGIAIAPDTVAYDESNLGTVEIAPGQTRSFLGNPASNVFLPAPLNKGVREPPALSMKARPDLCGNQLFASLFNGAVWQYVKKPCAEVKVEEARVAAKWIRKCEIGTGTKSPSSGQEEVPYSLILH